MKVRIDGRKRGSVAGDWTLDLVTDGSRLVFAGFERRDDKGQAQTLGSEAAFDTFDLLSTASRPALRTKVPGG